MNITIVNLGYVSKKTECFTFLYKMFSDPHISNIKNPILLKMFATLMLSRAFSTCKILKKAPSPLLSITISQAKKLQNITQKAVDYCFSYSKPICSYSQNRLILPLYTIYSKTLYGSLFALRPKKILPPLSVFEEFVDFYIQKVSDKYIEIKPDAVIFSNHSLPVKIAKGESYEKDTYIFCDMIAKNLNMKNYYIAFQSKLGPIKWLEPSTTTILASLKEKNVLIVPVSFVTDNTETIYEIDFVYANIAKSLNIKLTRLNCFNDDDEFIEVLNKILGKYI